MKTEKKSNKPKSKYAEFENKPVEYHPSFKNVAFEEDAEAAFAKCVEVLGPVGRYEMSGGKYVIHTQKHGPLWYGDLTAEDKEFRLPALMKYLAVDDLFLHSNMYE